MNWALFAAALVFLVPLSSAAYADVVIVLDEAGNAAITGTTDVELLAPGSYDRFTSKQGSRWLFNLTTPAPLESFVYEIRLPQGASVNFVTGANARLLATSEQLVVRGSGSDRILSVAVQYEMRSEESKKSFNKAWLLGIALGSILIAIGAKWKWPKKKLTIIDGLNERQQEIIVLLRKSHGALTQRQIEEALNVPKSSVSRNVESLRRRGIVEKEQAGMSNTVRLNSKYL